MTATETIWAFTLALTFSAGWIDWRTRRIPNWLTVPALLLGIAVHTVMAGWPGALVSLEGVVLALAILLPLVLLRALGAGDWKLMGAVGAFLGPLMFLFVLLASVFLSGLMAVVMMVLTHRVKTTLRNLVVLVRGFFVFGLRTHPEISLDNPTLLKLPFGVAAATGTFICFIAAHWG
ncbi:MAG: A24 family peptidase [Candidatus Acidiferrales bacterium]|jgi:prepilin peptidase CpaA